MKLSALLASDDQKQIEQTLQQRFASNLEFFALIHPKLHDQLLQPPENYNLIFNSDGANLIHLKDQSLIYPRSTQHSMLSVHADLAHSPLQNPKWNLLHNNLYLQKMNADIFPITAKAVNAFIDALDELGGISSFHLPSFFLPNTCIFGALGGLFVQFLLEEGMFFHSLLWFEEERDFFRIACFFVDFALLFERCSKRSCFLFIQDLIHRELITHYFQTHKITNNFLRLELCMYHSAKIDRARQTIKEAQAQNSRGWGSFEDECIGLENTLQNLKSNPPILSTPKRIDLPICVIGNGASLNALLPFIQENQSKMMILSCGTALKVLKNHGIQPDFQIEIERINYLDDVLKDAPLGDTPLVCGNMVSPSALALAKNAYLFMRGGNSSAYLTSSFALEFSSPFVGNAGVAIACAFGSDVILCGMDCGYIQGESKHAKGSYYGEESTQIPSYAFKVPANGDKEVYSTSIYALSASMMSRAIAHFKPNLVLNLGEGAYIQGARRARPADFQLKEKNKAQAMEAFKLCFQHQPLGVETSAYLHACCQFIEELKTHFQTPISSKSELFALIDSIQRVSQAKSASMPSVGILLEGSLAHLLQNLMICALHYPHNDIRSLYARCLDEIFVALDRYKLRLRLLCM